MSGKNRNIIASYPWLLPSVAGVVCVAAFLAWISVSPPTTEEVRVPIEHPRPEAETLETMQNPGTLIAGSAQPSEFPGSWRQFRGDDRDNIIKISNSINRNWPESGPPILWRIPVGEGFAGAAVHNGRVYLMDYNRETNEDAIRCLSLDNGEEIWRYTYSAKIKRNHGITRTIPAVTDDYVITISPKCMVHCLDAKSGEMLWRKDLVNEHGTIIPPWYAGQCPLIDDGKVILAPGGKPLMMALDTATGETVWETSELDEWGMTHSSIMAMEFNGRKHYIYPAKRGLAGVAADNGEVLWSYPEWKIDIANIPSALPIGDGRIFLCGGYGVGSAMIRLGAEGEQIKVAELFRRKPEVFGSTQHTPVLYKDHIFGVVAQSGSQKSELVCLNLEGEVVWKSGPTNTFGLGPYMIVNDLLLALEGETGILHMIQADPSAYNEIGKADLLENHEAWAPMAMAEGRLIIRDLTEMVCVDLGG